VISIREIIDDVINYFEFSIKEKPTVINILKNQPQINCNKLRLTEIYKNLIGNALKYNDKAERYIEVGYLFATSGEPIFYVKDNGIGIEEKHFENVFTIFKRLHPREKFGGGTGAGLTIAKKCIDLQCGDIWIESRLKEGTTFYFTVTEKT
jgi:light-regulated signal transduction histidine kinase (bacteriophytochrome)